MKLISSAFFLSFLPAVFLAIMIPYNISERRQPAGNDFSKLLPLKVGQFNRVEYKDPSPGLDGEATYRAGSKEIFMLFSKADSKADLRETMQTILDEVKTNKTTEARTIELKADPAFIHFIGPKIAFFAWTRGLYCFSADSKNADKKSLDEFMTAFPY
ncbi:hypothetical protein LZZ85_04320 [Terrimonas sp. NA20]|uniref:Uncharacterized protein n=1 Tax=Terrimonas ginsenosidimutans TaxID=2908004 RepID=A0ABS9KME9_9BACT|nr:hypothetical protein [Terrimonas ginsenosidimutans]MCG2613489.1 hypothetical protein [Terrimonas ginsenosidimutans]